ncbi:hypothetical protein [Streptomyces sp. C]|uniref:hypothetical protein n=1 Tax=Streptomyces sp. C TaxID=253839 RepID=UPI0001B57D7B|nr:hypothetical protein [Streptomyces sp. C]
MGNDDDKFREAIDRMPFSKELKAREEEARRTREEEAKLSPAEREMRTRGGMIDVGLTHDLGGLLDGLEGDKK